MSDQEMHRIYNLQDRTARFGTRSIQFATRISENTITKPLISQFVRSSTSVGAHYCEADNAGSRADFNHKIGICKKESRETMHWLVMLVQADDSLKKDATLLWKEAKELNLIFNAIIHSSNKK